MARQGINTGSSPDAGDGDALLTGALKINANFSEIYTALGDGTNITNSIGFAVTAGISTYATTAGIATYSTTAGIATYANSSRVVIRNSGSTVGTAGTIDFGDNLTVSAVSAGVVTVTGSGGTSSQWVTTAAGIHTLSNVGIGTTNPVTAFNVNGTIKAGVSTFYTFQSSAGFTANGDEGRYLQLAYKTNPNYILNSIGIGTTNATSKLTVQSTGSASDGENDAHPFAIKQGIDDRTLWMGYDTNIGGVGYEGAYINAASSGTSRPIYLSTRNVSQTPFVGIGTDRDTGTDRQMLQVGGGAYISGNLGIGSVDPKSALTVQGDVSVSGVSTFTNTANFGNSIVLGNGLIYGASKIILSGGLGSHTLFYNGGTSYSDFVFITLQGGSSLEVARINKDGGLDLLRSGGGLNVAGISTFVGIATAQSTLFANQLSVSGVSTFTGSAKVGVDTSVGVILTSPNGTQYQLFVEDDGTLNTVAV